LLQCLFYNSNSEEISKDERCKIGQTYISYKIKQMQEKLKIILENASTNYYINYMQKIPSEQISNILRSFQSTLRIFINQLRIEKTITQYSDLVIYK